MERPPKQEYQGEIGSAERQEAKQVFKDALALEIELLKKERTEPRVFLNGVGTDPILRGTWGIDNPAENALGEAFQQARTNIVSMGAGDSYWGLNYGMGVRLDATMSKEDSESTRHLLRLVIASRLGDDPTTWRNEVYQLKQDIRDELSGEGTDSRSERPDPNWDNSRFPGVTYDDIVEGLMTGAVQVGRQ